MQLVDKKLTIMNILTTPEVNRGDRHGVAEDRSDLTAVPFRKTFGLFRNPDGGHNSKLLPDDADLGRFPIPLLRLGTICVGATGPIILADVPLVICHTGLLLQVIIRSVGLRLYLLLILLLARRYFLFSLLLDLLLGVFPKLLPFFSRLRRRTGVGSGRHVCTSTILRNATT